MARCLSFGCLILTALVFGLFDSSHQAPYHPYLNPYVHSYSGPYAHQPRFNFNLNAGVVTVTAYSVTTVTSSTTVTCTRSTTACVAGDGANTNRFPFYNGIQKRSIEDKEFDGASQVESVEVTQVPEGDKIVAPRSVQAILLAPYHLDQLDSSMSREVQPFDAGQARLFISSTTTITVTQTSLATRTRTLTPSCSLIGFFTQCP